MDAADKTCTVPLPTPLTCPALPVSPSSSPRTPSPPVPPFHPTTSSPAASFLHPTHATSIASPPAPLLTSPSLPVTKGIDATDSLTNVEDRRLASTSPTSRTAASHKKSSSPRFVVPKILNNLQRQVSFLASRDLLQFEPPTIATAKQLSRSIPTTYDHHVVKREPSFSGSSTDSISSDCSEISANSSWDEPPNQQLSQTPSPAKKKLKMDPPKQEIILTNDQNLSPNHS